MSHPAFDLLREQSVPEVNSTARFYRHRKTGAEVLSLANDDENKVFGITFKTPPADSTGVAHILEHSVLCGSRKYPVKKPFVEMLKGSLQTFLNAMTFPEKTAYPVASQNLQDFYNLVDVYLDAVFFPLISEDTFRQEGWHYELEASQAPLKFKGVVFNEMKGAYSSPSAVLSKASQLSLYPDTTYGVNSGGDPTAIPDLSYEAFRDFHERFYHPSNARIVFYGDDPEAGRLEMLEAYLGQFEAREVDAAIAPQPRFAEPRRIEQTYAASEAEAGRKTGMVTVNWMLDRFENAEEALALSVLEQALVGNSAAPLRKALTDSGLGEGLTGSGLVADFYQPMFTVGLKGIAEGDAEKVEALILSTLERLAADGIDEGTVASALNTLEFALRENNTGSYPRGLSIMFRTMRTWLHGEDPLEPLAFEAPLQALKERLAAGAPIFSDLIRRHLLTNTHRTTVSLKADPGQGAREAAEERARLDAAKAAMDERALAEIREVEARLKTLQATPDRPEDLARIPTLQLGDLPAENKEIPISVSALAGVQYFRHEQPTNGIVYLDLGFDLRTLAPERLAYIPIFSRALLQTGTAKADFVALSQRIGRSTGGIYPSRWHSAKAAGGTASWLFLRAKATADKGAELLDILSEVVLTARLDNRERIKQMVLEEKAGFESRLAPAGNGIVSTRLRASLHASDWVAEQMGGVSYLFFLRSLAERIETDWGGVAADLEAIRTVLVDRARMVVNVTAEDRLIADFEPGLRGMLETLPERGGDHLDWPVSPRTNEGLSFPGQVNYVGKGGDLYGLGYTRTAATSVVLRHLQTTYLWDKVRVEGGAYGGSAGFDPFTGGFVFVSYRDPNLLETLDVYDGAAAFLREPIGEAELKSSIIGAIGQIDRYMLPDAKGFTSMARYLMEDTVHARQERREEVLGASVADFHRLADALDALKSSGRVVVLGSETALQEANAARAGLLSLTKVL
ncbi:peptidase M16 [Arsenicitalea aurantiaca]|uniref:Peptidase M16 n=1 Tax=Arsenicitalea aurantiaca TaxID=1783274 RepID=A0A433XKJ0_9HYPH|nr:insulinase family protein [Arsenicitalea aurantiaca]RUT34600.1 peptidase M16 [Arsenicitalea aurantiaca]